MDKYILPTLLIIGIFLFSFALYSYSKDSSLLSSGPLNSSDSINNEDKTSNTVNFDKSALEKNRDYSKTISSDDSSGDGGGSSGGDSNYVPVEKRINESSCVLIRPGNLPNVICIVDYINKNSVSLNIENKLGEDIGINLNLKTCSQKFQDNIKNNEKKNFIFSCNNYGYFNEEIMITYILKENGTVNVRGFINGPVV